MLIFLNISDNSQSGGDFLPNICNKNIKMIYCFQIINLLKKALQYLNNNKIYLDKKTIDNIKNKINIIEKIKDELNNNTTIIINYISKEKIILDDYALLKYINKNKILYSHANNISIKLGHILLALCNYLQ